MPIDLPPSIPQFPALVAPAINECRYLNNDEAQQALRRLKQALPGTSFTGAAPSEICGLVRVKLSRGTTAYTDATGRFFILAYTLDTHLGSEADATVASAIEKRETNPDTRATTPLEKAAE